MKCRITGIITALSITMLAGCSQSRRMDPTAPELLPAPESKSGGGVQTIDAQEARRMMDEGNVTIVDVRTEEEYQTGHIPGAVLVPNETIKEEIPQALPDQDVTLLVYCRTGIRAAEASDKLAKMGYESVYNFGGISTWPYETVADGKEE